MDYRLIANSYKERIWTDSIEVMSEGRKGWKRGAGRQRQAERPIILLP